MDKDIISYDKNGFIIHGKREFLIGGEFHYFKVPADLWEDRLQKMKAAGANLISVYIAWNLHEPVEGKQRWSGDYDLDRFLTLCQKYGFYVLIKPGPYICAELDFGGHPDWLIGKIARGEFRLRTLDKGYLELCRYWYKSCSEQIVKHLITNGGSIIAAQLENEYDHLIEYGEETITIQDAIDYFMFLKCAMEEFGINVPKFANEAEFLRGKGIIDTRTYYPNIPGLWMWEFERFEEKLLSSKKSQSDSPVMILELQAGWFSQIGSPTYSPGLEVVEGVSKSVFITGASIINYYMMVGGTSFPFIGARGDTVLGGHGNITSYDFGGAPVGETGELHPEKFHWLKGFIRFAREFNHIIAESDGKRYAQIHSGGENIAVLHHNNAELDTSLDKSFENFTMYEEGNKDGRFFFVRNCEDETKELAIYIPESLTGKAFSFRAEIKPKETRMFPLVFNIPGSDVRIGYSTSEILLSKIYKKSTTLVLYGRSGTKGELLLNTTLSDITVINGDISIHESAFDHGSVLSYVHQDISIVKVKNVYIFIVEEKISGRIEELSGGLFFHNCYYLQTIEEKGNNLSMTFQIKEHTENVVRFFPLEDDAAFQTALLNGNAAVINTDKSGMLNVSFPIGVFPNRPKVQWTSEWKYTTDSAEINPDYDHSTWSKLEKPISLEEAGFLEHGYYWYRTHFDLPSIPKKINMDFNHNETDRYLLYINGELVFRTRNKSIRQKDITGFVRSGNNTLVMLYANEFHNKSHPHEGAIVKYSGIIQPVNLTGFYSDGKPINIPLKTFYVKQGLQGLADGFTKNTFNDLSWQTAPDTDKYVISKEMGHIIWFRRHFRYNAESFNAPLKFVPFRADERLTVYCNGWPVARYDILGPQEEFYIPDSYINPQGDNVLAIILECPGFYEEIMSGFRRGYMYNPVLEPYYVSQKMKLEFK